MSDDESHSGILDGFVGTGRGDTGGESDEWATPPSVWEPIADAVGGFDVDVAAGCEPFDIADEKYTEEDDGLAQNWTGTVWCNPPYSEPRKWFEKAISEYNRGNADIVCLLLPARLNTNWFQDNVYDADRVMFYDRKLQFLKNGSEAPSANPQPIMLVTIGDTPDALVDYMRENGFVVDVDDSRATLDDF